MVDISKLIPLKDFARPIEVMWNLSDMKLCAIESQTNSQDHALVFTRNGQYTTQPWTDWTRGFHIGSILLQSEADSSRAIRDFGRLSTMKFIQPQVTNFGVHDHGFNVTSTYGTLLRQMHENRDLHNEWERKYYRQALITSGIVQAHRWTELGQGYGYIYSFNGAHSLFADTIRSLRALAISYVLGGVIIEEQDQEYSLLERMIAHIRTTSRYLVSTSELLDGYSIPGRVAHEAIFNIESATFRCLSTQQGYSPFTTWTRGLAWIILGYAEILEFFRMLPDQIRAMYQDIEAELLTTLRCAADYYIESTPICGVPYWDTGAPGLLDLNGWSEREADPFNDKEPVDSSAAAIAAQGLLRLGEIVGDYGNKYTAAGRRTAYTILQKPYLSTDLNHQGLLLHSVYHWPRRWDQIPTGSKIAHGESVMWGDYHLRELALYIGRLMEAKPYYTFANFEWNLPDRDA
ncbi:MAG: glycosyl hydrolase [Bacteroidetes bacterium]|nr:glycosyl hydrolase [Bacteroidota bacterium]